MDEKGKNEQLIDKLIKKRKEANDAFLKILGSIENKGQAVHENSKRKGKSKP